MAVLTPKVRIFLGKTKILNVPIFVLFMTLMVCLWFNSIELGASVFLMLLCLGCIRFSAVVIRKIRFMHVTNRRNDTVYNSFKLNK